VTAGTVAQDTPCTAQWAALRHCRPTNIFMTCDSDVFMTTSNIGEIGEIGQNQPVEVKFAWLASISWDLILIDISWSRLTPEPARNIRQEICFPVLLMIYCPTTQCPTFTRWTVSWENRCVRLVIRVPWELRHVDTQQVKQQTIRTSIQFALKKTGWKAGNIRNLRVSIEQMFVRTIGSAAYPWYWRQACTGEFRLWLL
jgi:hypothetical protein